jgi:4-methylaminobutanoate oxidase (formaldehyde-forming)
VRDLDWIGRHAFARVGSRAVASDATDGYAVLGVMGPHSRDLLAGLTDADLGDEAFPFATAREVTLAGAPVRATRMTYVGELGWELTVPVASAPQVYDAIRSAGERFGLADAGYAEIESLRLEKGYRAFGRELTPDFTPVEAGLVFATALDRSPKDFLGRDALAAHRESLAGGGPRRRLVSLVAGDADLMVWGGELVLRDGRPVGQVTSAAWGETVGACVGLAYVRHDAPVTGAWLAAGAFEIDVGGRRSPVRLSLRAPV